jgi:hypothetical protein
MQEIKILVDQIYEEFEDAEKYFARAKSYKEKNSTIANTYLELSIAELNHIDKLHSIVILLINNVKDLKKSIPIGMNEIWQWEHEKIVEKVEELRFKISKFKS